MRLAILNKLPFLSSRIHRSPDAEDHGHDPDLLHTMGSASLEKEPTNHNGEKWSWDAAENRLKDAYEKDGFSGWGIALLQEVEAEGKLEREKREHQS